MDPSRSNDVSPEAMQARIQQARREAETLKDRIKRKKDELADTTREYLPMAAVAAATATEKIPRVSSGLPRSQFAEVRRSFRGC